MNKNTFFIALALASGLLCAGCNKSGKLNQVSTFTPPSGPVELKQKWPVGEHIVQNFDMKMNMEVSMPNLPNPIKQDMAIGQKYGLTVLKEDAAGGHELEMEFLNMRMKMDQGGKTLIDYDSAKKPSDDKKDRMTASLQKTFQNIIGSKIQYFLDASNKVERIEGIDALMNQVTSGGRPDAAAGFKNMFNEGYFKQIIGSSQHLPPKPVQPGDTWQEQTDIPMGNLGNMTMNYNFTFQNWEKRGKRTCARLEFEGTLKSQPDSNPKPTGMSMSIQDGTFSGVSWFDPELGIVIESDSDQDMKMIMTMPMKVRGKTSTQTMTNLMHQTITMKLESVK